MSEDDVKYIRDTLEKVREDITDIKTDMASIKQWKEDTQKDIDSVSEIRTKCALTHGEDNGKDKLFKGFVALGMFVIASIQLYLGIK